MTSSISFSVSYRNRLILQKRFTHYYLTAGLPRPLKRLGLNCDPLTCDRRSHKLVLLFLQRSYLLETGEHPCWESRYEEEDGHRNQNRKTLKMLYHWNSHRPNLPQI